MFTTNISFQTQCFDIDTTAPVSMPMIPMNPRGVVIYPDNNSRWYAFAYYKNGQSSQAGRKIKNLGKITTKHGTQRKYKIQLHNGSTIEVASDTKLNKKAKGIDAYDPTTGNKVGYLNYELLYTGGGEVKTKPDSTGEFELIAKKLRKLYGLSDSLILPFQNVHDDFDPDGSKADTRDNFFDALEDVTETGLDFFAYAGHGGRNSLPSGCVRAKDMDRLADEIRRILRPGGIVIFYACSTGYPGGFASKLSEKLSSMAVWGHTDSGQASRNADKVCYRNGYGIDIRDILSVSHKEFGKYLLKSPDFYARFPFMTQAAIENEFASL